MSTTPITRRQWFAMLTLSLGVSLVVMDMTIVNVAVPVIIEDLGLTAAGAQWMNAIYLLMLASLLLAAGRLGDRIGRRRVYAAGLVLFMVASLSAGAAQNQEMLIAARDLRLGDIEASLREAETYICALLTDR